MFVVRIETDEALMFRAFRKGAAAKIWATAKSRDGDTEILVDVYEVDAVADEVRAIEAVRDGLGAIVLSSERVCVPTIPHLALLLASQSAEARA